MGAMEKEVRTIAMEGLVWGAAKLIPVAFGVKKLQIMCVVEDEKVSIDELSAKIEEFEDYVRPFLLLSLTTHPARTPLPIPGPVRRHCRIQ